MGAFASKSTKIRILLGKAIANPGSTVEGRVQVIVSKDFDACTSLSLRYTGIERIGVKYVSRTESAKFTRHNDTDKHCFAKCDFELARFPSKTLLLGTHEFPFTFTIPQDTFPSARCVLPDEDDGGEAEVNHFIEAVLHPSKWLLFDRSGRAALTVQLPPSLPFVAQVQNRSLRQPIHYMWLYSRGEVVTSLTYPKYIRADDVFSIQFSLLNITDVPAQRIEIDLVESVKWSLNMRDRKCDTVVASYMITDAQLLQHVPQQLDTTTTQLLHNSINSISANLIVSPQTRFTMKGTLITISHTLNLRIILPFGYDSCVMSCPIEVVS